MQRSGVVASLVFLFIFLALVTDVSNAYFLSQPMECSRKCIVENCDKASIRYGKYCGLAYSGCAGEQPCDDADACCQIHDNCVGKYGMMNVTCHKKFKHCIRKVTKSGKVGFSRECPYESVLPTMQNAMDFAIVIGDLGPKLNL